MRFAFVDRLTWINMLSYFGLKDADLMVELTGTLFV
jgi:hypothetical protein